MNIGDVKKNIFILKATIDFFLHLLLSNLKSKLKLSTNAKNSKNLKGISKHKKSHLTFLSPRNRTRQKADVLYFARAFHRLLFISTSKFSISKISSNWSTTPLFKPKKTSLWKFYLILKVCFYRMIIQMKQRKMRMNEIEVKSNEHP